MPAVPLKLGCLPFCGVFIIKTFPGLTVNHEHITVIEVKEMGRETTLLHYPYVTRSLEHLVRFMDHMERVLRGPEKLMRGLSIWSRGSGIGKAEDLERITRNIQMRAEERILEMEERLDKKLEKRLESSLQQRLENSLQQRFKEVENSLEQRLQKVENSLVQRFEEVESSLKKRIEAVLVVVGGLHGGR